MVFCLLLLVGCGTSQAGFSPQFTPDIDPAGPRTRLFVIDSRAILNGSNETQLPGQHARFFRFDLSAASYSGPQDTETIQEGSGVPVMLTFDTLTDTGYLTEDAPGAAGRVVALHDISARSGIHGASFDAVITGFRDPRGIAFSSADDGTLYVSEAGEPFGIWVLRSLRKFTPDSTRLASFYPLSDLGLPSQACPTQLAYSGRHQLLFLGLTDGFRGVGLIPLTPLGQRAVAVPLSSAAEVTGVAYDEDHDRLFVAQRSSTVPRALTPGKIAVFNQASQLSPESRPAYFIDGLNAPGYLSFDLGSGRLAVGTDHIDSLQPATILEHGAIEIFNPGSEGAGPPEVMNLESIANPTDSPNNFYGPYFDDSIRNLFNTGEN